MAFQSSLVFSVVLPTFRRTKRLRSCLEALSKQEFAKDLYEAIVVDDDSGKDPAVESCVASFRDALTVELITAERVGPAVARNRGAQKARGRFLAFTDDDCEPHPDWLLTLAEVFKVAPDVIVGGSTRCGLHKNQYSMASQDLVSYLYDYFNARAEPVRFIASNNVAVPRRIFETLKGFNQSFHFPAAEDREFCHRCLKEGFELVYEPKAVVLHKHELTPAGFICQHFSYGRGAYNFHQYTTSDGRGKIPLEPLSFYRGLVEHPLRKGVTIRTVFAGCLLLVSQGANAAGYLWEKLRA